jgi:hypothetical protein
MARPVVTGLSVHVGPTTGGTAVNINGTGFTGVTTVAFGGTNATFNFQSDTLIAATSPPHAVGMVDVLVTTPSGTSLPNPADQFQYMAPRPVVLSVNPNSGPAAGGTNVTVGGTSFTGATGVAFGLIAAPQFTVDSDTQIRTTSPAHQPGTVDILVTTPSGTSTPTAADRFTYLVGSPKAP